MADFDLAYARTNGYEGHGLSDVPSDRGGETYAGISRVMHPKWEGWAVIDKYDRRARGWQPTAADQALLDRLHAAFFRGEFWLRVGGNLLPDQDVANEVYDSAVNCGVGRAAEWLQIALNVSNRRGKRWPDVVIDRQIGQNTVDAVRKATSDPLHRWLVLQVLETCQRWHYTQLAMADPTQEDNLLGWFRLRVQQWTPPPT